MTDGVCETVKHEINQQESGIFGMLLGTLGASRLENMFTRKGVKRAGKGVLRGGTGHNNIDHMDKKNLLSLHPLSNIEVTKYFNNEPRFNGVC